MPNHIMASYTKSHVHSFPYQRKKLKDYVRLESFAKQTTLAEWATQGFDLHKKNKQIQLVTDFCMLN
jgi:hypothetical protein